MSAPTFLLDGRPVAFAEGQSILQAAVAAGAYIPHLCFHPDFAPHGSCKVCTVRVGGREAAACTTRAVAGAVVESDTPALNDERRALVQMLFVEGNHFCPSCERSGDCKLQATARDLGMTTPHYDHFYPDRPVDASHPELLLDFNRCILCSLCERASREVDRKNAFALSGRGIRTRLIVNSRTGRLADTDVRATDRAVHVCPVGAILPKRRGFATPLGQRTFDLKPISAVADSSAEIEEG